MSPPRTDLSILGSPGEAWEGSLLSVAKRRSSQPGRQCDPISVTPRRPPLRSSLFSRSQLLFPAAPQTYTQALLTEHCRPQERSTADS